MFFHRCYREERLSPNVSLLCGFLWHSIAPLFHTVCKPWPVLFVFLCISCFRFWTSLNSPSSRAPLKVQSNPLAQQAFQHLIPPSFEDYQVLLLVWTEILLLLFVFLRQAHSMLKPTFQSLIAPNFQVLIKFTLLLLCHFAGLKARAFQIVQQGQGKSPTCLRRFSLFQNR